MRIFVALILFFVNPSLYAKAPPVAYHPIDCGDLLANLGPFWRAGVRAELKARSAETLNALGVPSGLTRVGERWVSVADLQSDVIRQEGLLQTGGMLTPIGDLPPAIARALASVNLMTDSDLVDQDPNYHRPVAKHLTVILDANQLGGSDQSIISSISRFFENRGYRKAEPPAWVARDPNGTPRSKDIEFNTEVFYFERTIDDHLEYVTFHLRGEVDLGRLEVESDSGERRIAVPRVLNIFTTERWVSKNNPEAPRSDFLDFLDQEFVIASGRQNKICLNSLKTPAEGAFPDWDDFLVNSVASRLEELSQLNNQGGKSVSRTIETPFPLFLIFRRSANQSAIDVARDWFRGISNRNSIFSRSFSVGDVTPLDAIQRARLSGEQYHLVLTYVLDTEAAAQQLKLHPQIHWASLRMPYARVVTPLSGKTIKLNNIFFGDLELTVDARSPDQMDLVDNRFGLPLEELSMTQLSFIESAQNAEGRGESIQYGTRHINGITVSTPMGGPWSEELRRGVKNLDNVRASLDSIMMINAMGIGDYVDGLAEGPANRPMVDYGNGDPEPSYSNIDQSIVQISEPLQPLLPEDMDGYDERPQVIYSPSNTRVAMVKRVELGVTRVDEFSFRFE